MTKQQIVRKYLSCFCNGDIKGIEPLLATNLVFRGPLYSFDSREAYLAGLRNDPPEKCGYDILSITGNKDSVAVFYDYQKPDRVIRIAQLFRIQNQKISETIVIFDTSPSREKYFNKVQI